MTADFHGLRRDYYHRVACGPFEGRTDALAFSDIVLHLPVIEFFASRCLHCTEFGVRDGHSTVALLSGCKGEVWSYDVEHTPAVDLLTGMDLPCRWSFVRADTADPGLAVAETDFLFFDTLHTHRHLSEELRLHGRKARRYIGFHDTLTCRDRDVSGPDPHAEGIGRAIGEFLRRHPGEYRPAYQTPVNNGMEIYERR